MGKLLALDQSSRTSGYSIYNDKQLIDYGHFTHNDKDMGKRLMNIRTTIENILDKNDITEVVLEDIHQEQNKTNNVQTFKILAEVIGVIIELLAEKDIAYSLIQASVWKNGIGVSGYMRDAQKASAVKIVNQKYGVQPTEDEADAILIGAYWAEQNNKCNDSFDWS